MIKPVCDICRKELEDCKKGYNKLKEGYNLK